MSLRFLSSVKFTVGLAAAMFTSTALATRYWHGTQSTALFSDTANWSESSNGSTGASLPGSETGSTTFRKSKLTDNNKTIFNGAYTVGPNVYIETQTPRSAPFVWSATDPSYGLTITGDGWKFGRYYDKTPAWLQIESGTYSAEYLKMGIENQSNSENGIIVKGGTLTVNKLRIGGQDAKTEYTVTNTYNGIVVDGGTVTITGESGIGYASGADSFAEMIVNEGGTVNCNYGYFYVGESGPGALTMNGGTFTMVGSSDSNGGLSLGRSGNACVSTLTLNGGVLTTERLRLNYTKGGSRAIFNGTTIKPTRTITSFINANDNLTCEVADGGLVIDTAGYDVTIAHPFVAAAWATKTPLVKKGSGTLTLNGSTPFEASDITVYAGSVVVNGTTYGVNAEAAIDASAGGDLGEVVIHGEKLEGWLKDADYTNVGKYNAYGTAQLEQPVPVIIDVNGNRKTYINLETGKTYTDTISGVEFSFTTEDLAPRTLKILSTVDSDPVENVRDVGSWPLMGNAKMNQGVILRGGHLDHFKNSTAEQKAASALAGIKSEIDLRMIELGEVASEYQGVSKSWAAVDADYVYCPINYNTGGSQISSNDPNFTNQIRRVFSTWGNSVNLPSYFHCRIGTDRTGIVGLLLLGMMGVEEEVLYRDYLMSNFANIEGSRNASVPETFLRYILRGDCNSGKYVYNTKDGEYESSSVASRCRQYLEMCGVTSAEIANITHALSGETPAEVLARVNAYELAKGFRTVSYVTDPESGTTNATHRLAAGQNVFPRTNPTREGYVFSGWDTANESNGIVYALWSVDSKPTTRYWADANGSSEKFNRAESWEPTPDSMSEVVVDTLVLNKGTDKVATFEAGDAVSTSSLYIGEGDENLGGRLDVSGGTLTVTNYFRMGVEGSAPATNVVNISGGTFLANNIRTGHGDSQNGVFYDELNVSNGGRFESVGGETRFSDGSTGLSCMNITDGGSFKAAGNVFVGYSGKAVVNVVDSVFDMNGKHLYAGNSRGSEGEVVLSNITSTVNIDQLRIANSSGSVAKMEVSGENTVVNSTYAVYIGKHGNGELTINGGMVSVAFAVQFGDDDASGNTGVLNLNGGTLKVPQVNLHGNTTGVLNWNGGILERGNNTYVANGDMCPANPNLTVRVLEGGAFYKGSDTFAFSQPISGVGAFTKLGSGTLTLAGAVSLKGGFKVEAGTLNVSNITRTYFKAIEVAGDASLNLNGAEVTVERYVSGQTEYGPGTYGECGGVIHVVVPAVGDPATADWVNSLGDGDSNNPDNWIVRNSDGQVLNDVLPNANTAVYMTTGVKRPDLSGMTVKSATLIAANSVFMRGDCTIPEVAREAKCWFDFDDESTVTLADGSDVNLASIANKGTAKDTLTSAVAYGDNNAHDLRDPRYGENGINGRKIMLQTDLGDDSGAKSKCLRTEALGLEGNHDRALVVVSRRGSSTPHYPLGIEDAMYSDGNGHFRIERQEYSTHYFYCADKWDSESESFKPKTNEISTGQDPEEWAIRMFQSELQPAEDCLVSTRVYSEANGLTTNSALATNLNAQASAKLYMGYRYLYNSPSRGQIAEAFYFDRALTAAEQEALQAYLYAKWFTPADMSNIPSNIMLENNATLDFGGGLWTFDTIKGSGTLGTANIVVTGSMEPGLTVGGAVTFAEGATIDISPYDRTPIGTHVTFLTADSIVGWPKMVRSQYRMCALRIVDNGNGTVSLVGELAAVGFSVFLK